MKNALKETVESILSGLKKCCPTRNDNEYHIKGWHQYDEDPSKLTYESEETSCDLCQCAHPIERCPCARIMSK